MAGDAANFFLGCHTNLNGNFSQWGDGAIDEVASWDRQLSAAEVQAQFARLPMARPARAGYENVITSQSPYWFFTLDGTWLDAVNGSLMLETNYAPTVGGKVKNKVATQIFGGDYFGNANAACGFRIPAWGPFLTIGDNDALVCTTNYLIAGGGTYNGSPGSGKGTISCLFCTPGNTNYSGCNIFSTGGGAATTNFLKLSLNAANGGMLLSFGDAQTTILPQASIAAYTWYYAAVTYDETKTANQVQWWLGQAGKTLSSGTLSASVGSLAGTGLPPANGTDGFIIGNSASLGSEFADDSKIPGWIHEFAIWHSVLSGAQITNQFNVLTARPVLSITSDGTDAFVAWPVNTDPGFALQASSDLSSWSSAGLSSANVVGNNNVVTDLLGSGPKFYRLKK